jgi:hypothetical protein
MEGSLFDDSIVEELLKSGSIDVAVEEFGGEEQDPLSSLLFSFSHRQIVPAWRCNSQQPQSPSPFLFLWTNTMVSMHDALRMLHFVLAGREWRRQWMPSREALLLFAPVWEPFVDDLLYGSFHSNAIDKNVISH